MAGGRVICCKIKMELTEPTSDWYFEEEAVWIIEENLRNPITDQPKSTSIVEISGRLLAHLSRKSSGMNRAVCESNSN